MTQGDRDQSSREWSTNDRAAVAWLAALPAIGSAAFSVGLFPAKPGLWPIAFVLTAMGAYVTAFLGVMPLLFVFRQRGWIGPYHYAVAGFLGVLVPWFFIGMAAEYIGSGSAKAQLGEMLLFASSIGAACGAVFGWRSRERRAARSGAPE